MDQRAPFRADRICGGGSAVVRNYRQRDVPGCPSATAALGRHTRIIPTPFNIIDSVGQGLVANLSQPGANVTGFINLQSSSGPGTRHSRIRVKKTRQNKNPELRPDSIRTEHIPVPHALFTTTIDG
jgi:hypothetical protein